MKCGDPTNPSGPYLKRNGTPCGRDCAPGMTRCSMHGGSNPAAKIKAEQMMALARLPACEALFEIIEQHQANACPYCGFPRGDADEKRMIIQACKVILDRTGIGPHSTLTVVPQTDGDLNLELLDDQQRAVLAAALAEIQNIKHALREKQIAIAAAPSVH